MPIRLTITSGLFSDAQNQEVIVRDQCVVQKLLSEIQREYNLPDGYYTLRLQRGEQILIPDQTLEQSGVKTGDVLLYGIERKPALSVRSNTVPPLRAYLESEKGQLFDLLRQPALIGRPNPQKQLTSQMLDVDLTLLDPERTSSRPHARIRQKDGVYYLESIRDDNPACVNEQSVAVAQPHVLRSGDWLKFGKVKMKFVVNDHT